MCDKPQAVYPSQRVVDVVVRAVIRGDSKLILWHVTNSQGKGLKTEPCHTKSGMVFWAAYAKKQRFRRRLLFLAQ